MELLKLESVSKSFGGVQAVHEVSLIQNKDEITAIIGPNGAGKTTVFNLISGIYQQDAGKIFFRGMDISELAPHRRCALGISRTFQNIRLFNNMTVLENVKVSYANHLTYNFFDEVFRTGKVKKEERELEERAFEYLKLLYLDVYASSYPGNLPYGIQRRLELARALLPEPNLLLLDEPAAGLNPSEIRELMEMILNLQHTKKLSIIIVEHHMELVMNICSRIHVLDFGKKIAEGTPKEVIENEKVLQAYLGDLGEVC